MRCVGEKQGEAYFTVSKKEREILSDLCDIIERG